MNEQTNEITVNDVLYVRKDSIHEPAESIDGNSYVIVRCRNAGVHAGYLKLRADGIVKLINSRRLWRWWSKFTLSGLATCGVLPSRVNEVRFACVVPEIDLTESDVCEVLYATEQSRLNIESIKEHKNYE